MVKTSAIPRKAGATSFRVIDGQAVVMQAENAEVHILNDVGTRVWSLVDGKRSVEEIVALVESQLSESGEYESIPKDVGADVLSFFEDIEHRGMIQMAESGA